MKPRPKVRKTAKTVEAPATPKAQQRRRHRTKENILKRQAFVTRVLAEQRERATVAAYGPGLGKLEGLDAALSALHGETEAQTAARELQAVKATLGKATLSQREQARSEAEGVALLFERWQSLSAERGAVFAWAKSKLETEAAERKLKLEKYKELKAASAVGSLTAC